MDPFFFSTLLQTAGPLIEKLFQRKPEVPSFPGKSAREQADEDHLNLLTRDGAISGPMIAKSTRTVGRTAQTGLKFIDDKVDDPVERMNAVLRVLSDSSRMGADAVLDAEMNEDQQQRGLLRDELGRASEERVMRYQSDLARANILNSSDGWDSAIGSGLGNLSQNLLMQALLKRFGMDGRGGLPVVS